MRPLMFAAAAAAALAAGVAFAQPTVEGVTVIGRWTPQGEPPLTLSRVVSFGDLDLRRDADQAELRRRIDVTAGEICDELGRESRNHTNLGHSCKDEAVRGTQDQLKVAIADAMSRGPALAAAPPPPAPYVGTTAPPAAASAAAATTAGEPAAATVTTRMVTNGPVPDTPENRAKYGQPLSHAGKRTQPAGN